MVKNNITGTLAKFGSDLKFDDLPKDVVHETKRIILDILGCALGSIDLAKGRIAVEFARKTGGRPESTILITGEKVASPIAAFANGEQMFSLDHCSLMPSAHVAPFVTSACLALAEERKASGKTFITAVALAHETASRIGVSMGTFRPIRGEAPLKSFGFGNNVFGAAAGAAKIMGLDSDRMSDALGLAGYFAPVPSQQKFMYTLYNGLQKYGAAGWTAQGGVTAALLAEMGERGDRSVLDGEYGFWAMNGSKSCNWDVITNSLGKEWHIRQAKYKCWPCCGNFQSPLGAFTKLMEDTDIKPEDIQQIVVGAESICGMPPYLVTEIHNHVEAQNSLPYVIAVVAHRIKVGPAWQSRSTMENPGIRSLMKKIKFEVYPKAEEARYQELEVEKKTYINRRPSFVKVTAGCKVFVQTAEYAKWLSTETPEFRASDEDLIKKFRANAENTLDALKLSKAIDMIMNLEKLNDTTELIKMLIR
ncbi:MAG TPA: MmgE/PrpD family protein [Dehalococcoidales bacterium]|nr:MmgE/PrpD family protein [Dehalococcoidales bacterium]